MIGHVITGVIGIAIIVVTGLLLTGRGANIIAGFNTLSKAEKETYDKQALCRFVGKILIPIELAVFISVVGGMLNRPWSMWVAIISGVLGFPYMIAAAVYANTGNRFRK